jgi:uncharacterized membrane protein
MKARVRFMGHPVHQMLVVFPLGLLATSVVFDVLARLAGRSDWAVVGYWALTAGIVGAVLAAPFGLADWLKVPEGTRARRIGALHGLGNAVVSALFVAAWCMREPGEPAEGWSLACSLGGAGLALVTAWLGGELVSRLGVGVDEQAGLNAPSSLRDTKS